MNDKKHGLIAADFEGFLVGSLRPCECASISLQAAYGTRRFSDFPPIRLVEFADGKWHTYNGPPAKVR